MRPLATVLYEDSMAAGAGGEFPLHDLVLAMVCDQLPDEELQVWGLRRRIPCNPRRGINKLINDLAKTDVIASQGKLCVVVDHDRIARHLGLTPDSNDAGIIEALRQRSDAPAKLSVFFLRPNMEGLLASIEGCGGLRAPPCKNLNARDIVLQKVAWNEGPQVRDCVASEQPGLGDLSKMLADLHRDCA
ncbi:MAG: hypothetical protein H6747_13665 [Deltaproteobacteria bacterium]|nr:hypothetical protein [Deltaproteobacteria bacterium]